MIALLFCGMSSVDEVADDFDVSDNTSFTCVVEEATDTSSCVIVIFADMFAFSAKLIVDSVRGRVFLVIGSDITYDTTSLWVSKGLTGVLKIYISSIDLRHSSLDLYTLKEVLAIVLILRVHHLEDKEVGGGV